MLGFDLRFARDALTLSCRTCRAERHVDCTHSPDAVAAAAVDFCDAHASCCGQRHPVATRGAQGRDPRSGPAGAVASARPP